MATAIFCLCVKTFIFCLVLFDHETSGCVWELQNNGQQWCRLPGTVPHCRCCHLANLRVFTPDVSGHYSCL